MQRAWSIVDAGDWVLGDSFCRNPVFGELAVSNKQWATCPVLNRGYTSSSKMYKNDHISRRYSEGFKLKILAELSTGKYTKSELGRRYGVNRNSINKWIKKYDRKELMNTRIRVETNDELDRLKALQKEIAQLKDLLLKKDLENLMLDSYLEVAARNLGYKNVDELKKSLHLKFKW